jgi:hypothetical protein
MDLNHMLLINLKIKEQHSFVASLLAVTSTLVALEYALQALVLCFDGVPIRIIHQVIQLLLLLSFQPFAPQTSELYYHSFLASLLFVVLLTILGVSCYVVLSVGEDVIRVLSSPNFRARYMRRRLFPMKVLFRISLPVGVPSLDDMLSPSHASSRTIPSAVAAPEDEAACEEFHSTPLQRVYISLLNTFALQLEKANNILVAVSINNRRWIAMMARIV